MATKQTKPDPIVTVTDLINLLEDAYKHSTPGIWQKGQTTHDTVTETKYKIGSFHHANDASFVDVCHSYIPRVIVELKALVAITAKDIKPNS